MEPDKCTSHSASIAERIAMIEAGLGSFKEDMAEIKGSIKEAFVKFNETAEQAAQSRIEIALLKERCEMQKKILTHQSARLKEMDGKIYKISIIIATVFTGLGVGIDKILTFI